MNYIIIKLYILFIFNFLNTLENITFPIYTNFKEKNHNNNQLSFIDNYNNLSLITHFIIGHPQQNLTLIISLNYYPFIISNNSYQFINSSTYEPIDFEEYNVEIARKSYWQSLNKLYNNQTPSSDETFFGLENINLKFLFILKNNTNNILGLKYNDNEMNLLINSYNFIYQLKNSRFVDNNLFFIDIKEKNDFNYEGKLFFGNYPHNLNKKFNKENYNLIQISFNPEMSYEIISDKIFYNNLKILNESNIIFNFDINMIQGTKNFLDFIYQKFFLINKCKKLISNLSNFTYIICNKDVKVKKFKNLIFNIDKCNFTFTYKDLFKKIDDVYLFMIFFNEKNDTNNNTDKWQFGLSFFKKNMIVFEGDKRVIGVYLNNITNHKSNNFIKSFPWILVILCIFIILILSVIIFHLIINKRKKKANELEDNYEYLINK